MLVFIGFHSDFYQNFRLKLSYLACDTFTSLYCKKEKEDIYGCLQPMFDHIFSDAAMVITVRSVMGRTVCGSLEAYNNVPNWNLLHFSPFFLPRLRNSQGLQIMKGKDPLYTGQIMLMARTHCIQHIIQETTDELNVFFLSFIE